MYISLHTIVYLSCSNSRAKESSTFGPFHFHFNSVAALKVLLVRAKARFLIDMVFGVCGILPENFRQKCVLWHAHVHFDWASLHKTGVELGVSGTLPRNFRIKVLLWLVTCPFAFRPRRLARNGRCGRGIRHFPCIFCKKMGLAICPCAFRLLKTCG